MKANKLMLAMAAAAITFAACNKQDTTPQVEIGTKSVSVSIANVFQTKSLGTQVEDGSAIQLNSFQIFFSDGTTLYTPKSIDAKTDATTRFTEQESDNLYEFHFLPKAVNKVIVVGNADPITASSEAALLTQVKDLSIGDEQNPTALTLLGVDAELTVGENQHPEMTGIQHPDPFVHADVNLVPTIARFEVIGFEYAQLAAAEGETAPARNYAEMVVNSLSVRNWYTTATTTLAGVTTPGTTLDPYAGEVLTKENIYGDYFSKEHTGWYYDAMTTALNTANSYVAEVAGEAKEDCYAYHVFPGAVPQFIIGLTGKDSGLSTPLYLMTSSLKRTSDNVALTAENIEAGKAYRMEMVFDDSNLQQPEKCIEVNVTVDDWNVILITPEF